MGLVASPTRAGVVREWLREETTIGDERIAALRAPAGMDIGAETAEEVALSILAELVQVRRGRADFVASPGTATVAGVIPGRRSPLEPVVDDIVVLDPVCGMTVERAHAPAPGRARRSHLRVLLDRMPDPVHQGAGNVPDGDRRIHRCTTDRHSESGGRMHFEGSVAINASREKVWAFVIDPDQVGQCGPGVEKIEVIDPTHFKATAKVGVGFISARFNVNMEFAELDAPDRAVIKAHGQAPGSAVDATAQMHLSDGEAAGPSWTGRRTSICPARSRASGRG